MMTAHFDLLILIEQTLSELSLLYGVVSTWQHDDSDNDTVQWYWIQFSE